MRTKFSPSSKIVPDVSRWPEDIDDYGRLIAKIINAVGRFPVKEVISMPIHNRITQPEKPERGIHVLCHLLDNAAIKYEVSIPMDPYPKKSQFIKQLKVIENAINKVLTALDPPSHKLFDKVQLQLTSEASKMIKEMGGLKTRPPFIEDRYITGEEYLNDILDGLVQLREWTVLARGRASEAFRPTIKRNKGNKPLNELLYDLCDAWEICFGSKAAISRNASNKPGGPFFRFTLIILQTLKIGLSEEALATRIKRTLVQRKNERKDMGNLEKK